jgi:hypothetical protein
MPKASRVDKIAKVGVQSFYLALEAIGVLGPTVDVHHIDTGFGEEIFDESLQLAQVLYVSKPCRYFSAQ